MKKFLFAMGALAFCGDAAAEAINGKPTTGEVLEATAAQDWRALDPGNTLYIELERGRVVVALSPQLAQAHVGQVKKLAREGFYDGLSFYRVIDGFVAQGGDLFEGREVEAAEKTMTREFEEPLTDGVRFAPIRERDGYADKVGFIDSLPAGYDKKSKTVWHLHCTGAFAFGRNDDLDSASTEFYVALQPQRYLDRNLTVFGRVIDGMQHLQMLRRVSPAASPEGDLGETILSIRVAADVPEGERSNFEILDSNSSIFADYVEARRNRSDSFFNFRHDYIDVCQLPVPVRPVAAE